MTSNRNNGNPTEPRYIEIDGQQIPVTEEVYLAYKRPLWAEHKRKERAKRCREEHGHRCTKSCRNCPNLRDGGDLSLEKFAEDGFDIAAPDDVAETALKNITKEQLAAALLSLEAAEQALINALIYNDRTERDYAAKIDISHQAVGKRKKKVIQKLRWLMNVD